MAGATIIGSWCAVITGHVSVTDAVNTTGAALGLAALHNAIKVAP